MTHGRTWIESEVILGSIDAAQPNFTAHSFVSWGSENRKHFQSSVVSLFGWGMLNTIIFISHFDIIVSQDNLITLPMYLVDIYWLNNKPGWSNWDFDTNFRWKTCDQLKRANMFYLAKTATKLAGFLFNGAFLVQVTMFYPPCHIKCASFCTNSFDLFSDSWHYGQPISISISQKVPRNGAEESIRT